MTLEEARKALGRKVTYRSGLGVEIDKGTIVGVSATYVKVLYQGDYTAKATRAEDLEFTR